MAGLFKNLFRKMGPSSDSSTAAEGGEFRVKDVPEDVFVEKRNLGAENYTANPKGILAIYNYLEGDFETKGFDDAMISPDESYKRENLRLIKYDLEIIIQKVRLYHDSLLKDLEFHILSRERAGLIDLVEELKSKKKDLEEHIQKVNDMEASLKEQSGLCERAILSYQRGFTKGMAAITQASLLSKPF